MTGTESKPRSKISDEERTELMKQMDKDLEEHFRARVTHSGFKSLEHFSDLAVALPGESNMPNALIMVSMGLRGGWGGD